MRDYVLMSVLCSLLLFTFAFFPSYRCRYICCLVIILGTETDDAIRCRYRYDISSNPTYLPITGQTALSSVYRQTPAVQARVAVRREPWHSINPLHLRQMAWQSRQYCNQSPARAHALLNWWDVYYLQILARTKLLYASAKASVRCPRDAIYMHLVEGDFNDK